MSCAAPEKELLVFLAAGTLEPAEREKTLRHAAGCPECTQELQEGAHLAHGLRSLHLTSDEAVEAAWAGTRPPHLDECSQCAADVQAVQRSNLELAGAAAVLPFSAPAQPRTPWSRLASALTSARVAYAGMAAALLVAVLSGRQLQMLKVENERLRGERHAEPGTGASAAALAEAQREREEARRRSAELQAQLAQLSQPQLNVPIVNLEGTGAHRGDPGAPALVEVPRGAGLVTVVLHLEQERREHAYAVEIRDGQGRSVWRGSGLVKSAFDTFTLGLPRTPLPAGAYEIRLLAEEGGQSTLVDTYRIHLKYR